jgi:hypothetical protein
MLTWLQVWHKVDGKVVAILVRSSIVIVASLLLVRHTIIRHTLSQHFFIDESRNHDDHLE